MNIKNKEKSINIPGALKILDVNQFNDDLIDLTAEKLKVHLNYADSRRSH